MPPTTKGTTPQSIINACHGGGPTTARRPRSVIRRASTTNASTTMWTPRSEAQAGRGPRSGPNRCPTGQCKARGAGHNLPHHAQRPTHPTKNATGPAEQRSTKPTTTYVRPWSSTHVDERSAPRAPEEAHLNGPGVARCSAATRHKTPRRRPAWQRIPESAAPARPTEEPRPPNWKKLPGAAPVAK